MTNSPTSMDEAQWASFLKAYSQEMIQRQQLLEWAEVPSDAREKCWLGYPPASEEQIQATEQRLGIRLPEDLRAFYRVTNGWMLCCHSIYDIRPVEEICWLQHGEPDLWSMCQVDEESALTHDDEDEQEWAYEQGIKVCRSLLLNTRGDDRISCSTHKPICRWKSFDLEPGLPGTPPCHGWPRAFPSISG